MGGRARRRRGRRRRRRACGRPARGERLSRRADLDTLLQEVRDPSTGTSPRVTVTREPGPAAESLLRVAEREGADLIVVGSRGLGGTARQLGSTSEAVVQHSRLPVVVVPGPDPTGTSGRRDVPPLRPTPGHTDAERAGEADHHCLAEHRQRQLEPNPCRTGGMTRARANRRPIAATRATFHGRSGRATRRSTRRPMIITTTVAAARASSPCASWARGAHMSRAPRSRSTARTARRTRPPVAGTQGGSAHCSARDSTNAGSQW